MGAEHRVGSKNVEAPAVVQQEDVTALGPNERRAYAAAKRTDNKRRRREDAHKVRPGHNQRPGRAGQRGGGGQGGAAASGASGAVLGLQHGQERLAAYQQRQSGPAAGVEVPSEAETKGSRALARKRAKRQKRKLKQQSGVEEAGREGAGGNSVA